MFLLLAPGLIAQLYDYIPPSSPPTAKVCPHNQARTTTGFTSANKVPCEYLISTYGNCPCVFVKGLGLSCKYMVRTYCPCLFAKDWGRSGMRLAPGRYPEFSDKAPLLAWGYQAGTWSRKYVALLWACETLRQRQMPPMPPLGYASA